MPGVCRAANIRVLPARVEGAFPVREACQLRPGLRLLCTLSSLKLVVGIKPTLYRFIHASHRILGVRANDPVLGFFVIVHLGKAAAPFFRRNLRPLQIQSSDYAANSPSVAELALAVSRTDILKCRAKILALEVLK